jgi:hypothetical protein
MFPVLLQNYLEQSAGEITPELEQQVSEFLQEAPSRIEAAAMVVKGFQGMMELCKAEEKRIAERRKSFELNADGLKRRMRVAVDSAFGGKVKTGLFTVSTQAGRQSISISKLDHVPIESIPAQFTKLELNTDAVREFIKGKEDLLFEALRVLDNLEATEEKRTAAAQVLSIIPEGLSIEITQGERFLTIR